MRGGKERGGRRGRGGDDDDCGGEGEGTVKMAMVGMNDTRRLRANERRLSGVFLFLCSVGLDTYVWTWVVFWRFFYRHSFGWCNDVDEKHIRIFLGGLRVGIEDLHYVYGRVSE